MFNPLALPLIVMSAHTHSVLAVRVNDPKSPYRGSVKLLRTVEHPSRDITLRAHADYMAGELSGLGVYNRIESLFPKELGQIDINPFSKMDVRWAFHKPAFILHHEPHIFSGMMLQNQMVMAHLTELSVQDRMHICLSVPEIQPV